MSKPKMFSIGNHDKFNYFIIEKNHNSIDALEAVLAGLNVFINHQNLPQSKKEAKKVKIEGLSDVHISEDDDDNSVRFDLFFGKERVFVTAVCSQSTRKKINEKLFESFEMSEKGKGGFKKIFGQEKNA